MLTVQYIIDTVTPILRGYGIKDAVLFGSYAKGCAVEQSDIDLYVDSGLRGLKFFGLLGDVCDAFSVPVDLVDKQMVTPGGALEVEIMKTGRRFDLRLCVIGKQH